jgi:hypothetical protein
MWKMHFIKAIKKPLDNKEKLSVLQNNNGKIEYSFLFEKEEAVKLAQLCYQN